MQHRPSDFTLSEDAGIDLRTVAITALTVRRSNHSARSHTFYASVTDSYFTLVQVLWDHPRLYWAGSGHLGQHEREHLQCRGLQVHNSFGFLIWFKGSGSWDKYLISRLDFQQFWQKFCYDISKNNGFSCFDMTLTPFFWDSFLLIIFFGKFFSSFSIYYKA